MSFLHTSLAAVSLLAALLGLAGSPNAARAASGDEGPNVKHYEEHIRPLLVKHCLGCHGGEKPKADFRIDRLSADLADKANREKWLVVLEQLTSGVMPPKEKARPPGGDVRALADWISRQVQAAEGARRTAQGRVVLRRLNRGEYENTVRDLLGVDVDLKEQLPQDGTVEGFDNVGAGLHTSSFLMEKYLEAADTALTLAIANRPKPPTLKKRYLLKDQHQVKNAGERVFRQMEETTVLFCSSAWQAAYLSQFYPRDSERGNYRFRISAYAIQSAGKPVTFRVTAGANRGRLPGKSGLVGYFDAPADKPTVFEFVTRIEPRTTMAILPYGLAGASTVHKVGADAWDGPGLAVQWVDVEGPLYDTWPPAGHREIFGDQPQAPMPVRDQRDRVEVVSQAPLADAERIFRRFVRRAYRRAVTDGDIKPFLDLFQAKMAEKYSFEQAVRVGLLRALLSPEFLFLPEKPGRLDDFALASRLSYFLWSTMPDEELLTLAERGQLSQPATVRRQVERMLRHPRAAAFTENFVGQWLSLRDIDFTEPSHILYPEFDHLLKVSMIRETELFFAELLKDDLSLTNFVASDFGLLNGRLAKHYGIPGVKGWEFRKVQLPKESHRGGVLTMASVLKVTANGTYTQPVTRGAFVLDRILGTPAPPPPGDVPAIVPDIRGAVTIREQLAKHRSAASCAGCHAKIDPPGFALEHFDVIGGWRDHYRTSGNGQAVMVDGRRMPYLKGKPVEAGDVLPDGQPFANIDEFKQILLKDKDQLARALTVKLLTYATGGTLENADGSEIEAIVGKVRDRGYGFRTLLHEIVQSKPFRYK
jgi:hypothetical protein